jgi:hypothetical protein
LSCARRRDSTALARRPTSRLRVGQEAAPDQNIIDDIDQALAKATVG